MSLTVIVRHRHLGGGDQPEIVHLAMVHVVLHLRQLAGADHRGGVHHEGREHLGVALALGVQVEHILDERALEPRALAQEDGEARARELDAAREVEDAEPFAQGDVVQRLEVEGRHLAHVAHVAVGGAVGAGGDVLVGHVGDAQHGLAEGLLGLADLRVLGGDGVAHRAHLGLHGLDVLAGLDARADGFGDLVALGLERVGLGDQGPAPGVERQHVVHERGVHPPAPQTLAHLVGPLTNPLDIEHGSLSAKTPLI